MLVQARKAVIVQVLIYIIELQVRVVALLAWDSQTCCKCRWSPLADVGLVDLGATWIVLKCVPAISVCSLRTAVANVRVLSPFEKFRCTMQERAISEAASKRLFPPLFLHRKAKPVFPVQRIGRSQDCWG